MGLIIAGIAVLVTLIASITVSENTLSLEVKTATFVNLLAKMSLMLWVQEDLDRHLTDQKTDWCF